MRLAHGGRIIALCSGGHGLLEMLQGQFVHGQMRIGKAQLEIIGPGQGWIVEAFETGVFALEEGEALLRATEVLEGLGLAQYQGDSMPVADVSK
jgi:hypothetical protein